jgi:hypothetical protein
MIPTMRKLILILLFAPSIAYGFPVEDYYVREQKAIIYTSDEAREVKSISVTFAKEGYNYLCLNHSIRFGCYYALCWNGQWEMLCKIACGEWSAANNSEFQMILTLAPEIIKLTAHLSVFFFFYYPECQTVQITTNEDQEDGLVVSRKKAEGILMAIGTPT